MRPRRERYLNRGLRPLAGYSPYPGDRSSATETWFDDNGWWGLAFVNAYRATGERRWLADAQRALDYIAAAGWDAQGGGIWWNTLHPYKAGEALASGTLLATLLYQQTQAPATSRWRSSSSPGPTQPASAKPTASMPARASTRRPIDYIESPLIYAQALLCQLTGTRSYCSAPKRSSAVALKRFGYLLDFSPQYDAIYLQWMLALYSLDHDPTLYASPPTTRATRSCARSTAKGLYLLSWSGESLPAADAQPGMLQTQAATASLFAWLAVYEPPR